ncbi:MAG: hypothetical protein HYX54_05185 [Chloroflexi bacterium]|nr:hypothetical protein [Chloroflexota bacterium]
MSRLDGIALRPAVEEDLPACEEIWRDALNDYLLPLGQMEIPPDNPGLRQLHAHVLATDPELFWVAERPAADRPSGDPGDREDRGDRGILAFAAAARRGPVWFLSMLFVRPSLQQGGIGRALLERMLPPDDAIVAVATDAAQPISNGLYASVGMVARMPMFNVVGRPLRREALVPLPDGLVGLRFDSATTAGSDASGGPKGPGGTLAADLAADRAELDRDILGFDHQVDHAFFQRQDRIGIAYRDSAGRLAGYGYTSAVGRVGPVATREKAHLAPVLADLLDAVPPRGASAVWIPGHAGEAMATLIRAGLRIEGFPVLLGWTRPFADFERYIPASPGLL